MKDPIIFYQLRIFKGKIDINLCKSKQKKFIQKRTLRRTDEIEILADIVIMTH
jgi:hypothetical protein